MFSERGIMARGRFISRAIITDRAVNELSSDTCRLAWTWLITLADREGRIIGEPELLLAALFPRRRDILPETIQQFIKEWVEKKFVIWYLADDGDRYMQLLNFEKHQIGLRKEREPESEIQSPDNCRIIAGTLPEEIGLREVKLSKDKVNAPAPSPAFSSLRDTYQSQVRVLAGKPEEIDSLQYMAEKGITTDDLKEAIHFFKQKNITIREPEQLEKSAFFAMNKRMERQPVKKAEIQWNMEEYINQLCAEEQHG